MYMIVNYTKISKSAFQGFCNASFVVEIIEFWIKNGRYFVLIIDISTTKSYFRNLKKALLEFHVQYTTISIRHYSYHPSSTGVGGEEQHLVGKFSLLFQLSTPTRRRQIRGQISLWSILGVLFNYMCIYHKILKGFIKDTII